MKNERRREDKRKEIEKTRGGSGEEALLASWYGDQSYESESWTE